MPALYAHKRKVSSFFLNFFSWGVGPRVWGLGCGSVGAWVWVRGSVGGGGGIGMGRAGWRRDGDMAGGLAGWNG